MYLIVMKVILETQNVVFFKHNIFYFFSNYSICNFHHITSLYNSQINKTISTLRGVCCWPSFEDVAFVSAGALHKISAYT